MKDLNLQNNMFSPEEVMKRKCKDIPASIYTAIDELLIENYDFPRRMAIITYYEIFDRVALIYSDIKQVIRWFSDAAFEYEKKGWEILDTEKDGGGIVFKGV